MDGRGGPSVTAAATALPRGELVVPALLLGAVEAAFLVGSALAQTVVDSIASGRLAAGLGSGLCVWGALTRVRRRAAAGAGSLTAAVLLVNGVPLADMVRESEVSTSKSRHGPDRGPHPGLGVAPGGGQ